MLVVRQEKADAFKALRSAAYLIVLIMVIGGAGIVVVAFYLTNRIVGRMEQMDAEKRGAKTLASAIEINRPVNLRKCLRAIDVCDGLVRTVTDEEILDAKAMVGRTGLGCEPASAASVAGLRKLRGEGIIGKNEKVVCILTGHALKDPNVTVDYHKEENLGQMEKYQRVGVKKVNFANRPIVVADDLDEIIQAVKA